MTKKMIEELLELITIWLDDIRDIRVNSLHMDELVNQLEQRVNDIGSNINGLEKDVQNIEESISEISDCVVNNKQKAMTQKGAN
ncbi:hypothetical protein [Oceanobacillus senegalensis]|uniref:hypothetical protein n=1 Tax=Oceanobacillus senegalensis TaxID=1936063 RepID=UPI000A311A8F|nr:hypothetical protein [Oceanobacillus senegalensis]